MKLSHRLQSVADGDFFDGEALRLAFDLEHTTTANDIQMLSRYMYGNEIFIKCIIRWRLCSVIVSNVIIIQVALVTDYNFK